jgi:hypothetical protein
MKRELELKDICGYLPYRVYIRFDKNGLKTEQIVGISKNGGYTVSIYGECIYSHHNPKLILRPLSDLYKTITHNGKEIVPILELAKTACPWNDWYISETNPRLALCTDYAFAMSEYISDGDGPIIHFSNKRGRAENLPRNRIFDHIHELKIDCRGLINIGLAIDANTLETNPYKSSLKSQPSLKSQKN